MQNLKVKMLSVAMAALTAATPILSSYVAYASDITVNDDGTVTQISTSTGEKTDETKFLFANLKTAGGKVVINEGEDSEQTVRLEKQMDRLHIDVYDKDDVMISSENAIDNGYTYVYEAKADDAVNVKAYADDGYVVKLYELTDDSSGTEIAEDVGFDAGNKVEVFKYPVFMEHDKTVKIGFEKKESAEDIAKDLSVNGEGEETVDANSDDLNVNENTDVTVDDADSENAGDADITDSDLTVPDESEAESNAKSEETGEELDEAISEEVSEEAEDKTGEENGNEISVDENTADAGTEEDADVVDDADVNDSADDAAEVTTEPIQENHARECFANISDEISSLDSAAFTSARIIVMTKTDDDAATSESIVDREHVISTYGNIALLQYKTVEQAMTAYLYYKSRVDSNEIYAVEPDSVLEAAAEETEEAIDGTEKPEVSTATETAPEEGTAISVTNESNPIAAVSSEVENGTAKQYLNLIALIDTGASESKNVVNRVSFAGDELEVNGHGDEMVDAIVGQNKNAEILSIRAMDENGKATVSSVVAGMEYAISQNAKIINLSMAAKRSLLDSVIEEEIAKATKLGIIVVGAAGNDGKDAGDYMPGFVNEAYIIGACDGDGVRLSASNFGLTVDYYAAAHSTSEAAAKFTGYVSENGIDNIEKCKSIFKLVTEPSKDDTGASDIVVSNKADQKLLFFYALKAYGKDFVENAKSTDFAELYGITDDEMPRIEQLAKDYFDNYDLNKYLAQDSVLQNNGSNTFDTTEEEQKENSEYLKTVCDNLKISSSNTYLWDATIDGTQKEGAKIYNTDGNYKIKLVSGQMSDIIENQMYTEPVSDDNVKAWNPVNGTTCDYAWEVQKNGTIDIYAYPSEATNTKDYLCGTIKPEDGEFKAASGEGEIHGAWNRKEGSREYCEWMGINDAKYLEWLDRKSNRGDTYYLGTPYSSDALGYDDSGAYPNGDHPGTIARMNCTAFVWHVLWKSMQASGRGGTPSDFLGGDRTDTFHGWTWRPVAAQVNRMYFRTKEDLFKIGKPQKGDIIWCMAKGEYTLGYEGADNHVLIYMGENGEDKAWHSIHKGEGYCDGTNDGHPGGHAVRVNGNCITEIVTKQKLKFGYVLYKATDGPSLKVRKRIKCYQIVKDNPERYSELDTEFTVYNNSACDKAHKVASATIKNSAGKGSCSFHFAQGGIYYVVETNKLNGCTVNTVKYKCKLKGNKAYDLSDFVDTAKREGKSMDDEGYVLNIPIYFRGKILTKKDETSQKPLANAVFRIRYSYYAGDNFKAVRTWYMYTDKNGEIKYDYKHLADKAAAGKFKKKYKSSKLYTYSSSDETKTALPLGSIKIKEVEAPDGYAVNSKEVEIKIKGEKDKNGQYTIQEAILSQPNLVIPETPAKDTWKVRVQAKKVDENGKGLAGAKFDLFDSEDCSGDPIGVQLVSKDDGTTNIATIDKIPQTAETYEIWCKEVQAPPGYAISETPVKLTFKLADFKKLSKADQEKGELKIFAAMVNYKGWPIRVNAKKIDINGVGLEGAEFTVYRIKETGTVETEDGAMSASSRDEVGKLVTKKDGMSNELSIGINNKDTKVKLLCIETKAPDGYSISEESKKGYLLEFDKEAYKKLYQADKNTKGELKTFGPEKGIVNPSGWKARVNTKKVDGDGKPLAGARFGVYSSSALDEDSFLGELVSTESGETNILELSFEPDYLGDAQSDSHVLYCHEIEAPEGYLPSEETFSVKVNRKEYEDLVKKGDKNGVLKTFCPEGIKNPSVTPTPTISVTPTPPTGGLYVKKTSKAPKDIMDLKSYTLAGAEYRVTSSRDASFNTVIKTNEAGYTESVTLPDNSIPRHLDAVYDIKGNLIEPEKNWIEKVQTTYYITEIKAPNYHTVYSGTKSQPVVMPDDAGQTFEIPFENEPIFCDGKLDIEKLGVKGDIIPGAVFKVEYFDADGPNESDLVRTWYLKSDTQGHVRMDESHLDGNNQSDDFFRYDGNIVIPIGGYLQITEIDAPAEYVVETEPVGIPTTKDADFTLTYENGMKPWYEELERCRINLKKYQADGKTPIAGVEFELKFLEQAIKPTSKKHPNFKRLLEEGDSTIRHTDENGDVFFDNLDQGTYQITEIKTLDGNSLLKEPIIVTVPMTMTEAEANEYGNVNYETAKEDKNYSGKWYFYECLYEITNNATFKMPMTGDDGKWKYGFIGLGIVMAISAGFVICNTKSKKVKKRKHKK